MEDLHKSLMAFLLLIAVVILIFVFFIVFMPKGGSKNQLCKEKCAPYYYDHRHSTGDICVCDKTKEVR